MESNLLTGHDQRISRTPEGHSLLEMMTVMLLILIVASISMPIYHSIQVRAREQA